MAGLFLVLAASPRPARAQGTDQDDDNIFQAYAEWVVEGQRTKWKGQRVPHPIETRRPDGMAYVLRSALHPLAVHAGPDVPVEDARRALTALEGSADLLRATGWPAPLPDGGRGGTGGFDLYLVPTEHGASAHADAPVAWSYLDAVSSFAEMDPGVDPDRLEACVTSAYAQAALLDEDPAEAAAWRRATGTWLAFMATGRWGCEPGEVEAQQREAGRSWIGDGVGGGDGGALLLALISAQHDRGTGRFVRDMWELSRRRTWEGDELRGGPDMWQALKKAFEVAGEPIGPMMADLSVERWFSGPPERARWARWPVLAGLPEDAAVPVTDRLSWNRLPMRSAAAVPAIRALRERLRAGGRVGRAAGRHPSGVARRGVRRGVGPFDRTARGRRSAPRPDERTGPAHHPQLSARAPER